MNNKIRNFKIILLAFLLVFSFACTKNKDKSKSIVKKPVKIILAKSIPFESKRTISGIALAEKDILLSAETSGKLEFFNCNIGQEIKKSEVLAKIDQEMYKSQLNSAKANHDLAKINYNIQNKLYKKNLISIQQFQSTKTQLQIAKSNLNIAKIQFKKTSITSPINGIVAEKYIDKNEFIGLGQPICRVVNLDPIKIKISITGKDLPALKQNDLVTAHFSSIPDKRFKGTIVSIGSVADTDTKTFPIEIKVSNPNHLIKVGMLCSVSFTNAHFKEVVVIPQDIIIEGETKYVFVVSGNIAIKQDINILATEQNNSAISGIKPDTKIISTGHKNLVGGENISIIN